MSDVTGLADRFWDFYLRNSMLSSLQRGDRRYGDSIEDLSAEGQRAQEAELRGFASEAQAMQVDPTDWEARITRDVVAWTAWWLAELASVRVTIWYPNHAIGLLGTLWNSFPRQAYVTAEHGEAALTRHRRLPAMLGQLTDRLRSATRTGWLPHATTVRRTISQLDEYLAVPPDRDRLLGVAPPAELSEAEAGAWRRELQSIVAGPIRSAFGRYRDALRDEILPHARPDDRAGLCWLDGGAEQYSRLVRGYTTLELTPEEIHQMGLDTVAELDEEYRALGDEVFGIDDLPELYRILRDEPELRYASGAALVRDAERVVATATARMGEAFSRVPEADCVVRETDVGPAAFYQMPAKDGSRPGTFFVNTSDPGDWGRFEVESLTFHEAIPGHHFDRALAQELDGLHELRANMYISAFNEGWGLYAERLADELGWYSSDLARLGMLSNDSMRATRLVVDTGLHALRWSRKQAIDYMVDNSPMSRGSAAEEVDRYLGLPGQAVGYMVGRKEIVRIRAAAEQQLGDRFDLKGFHDRVLANGTVPLPTLAAVVDDWVASLS